MKIPFSIGDPFGFWKDASNRTKWIVRIGFIILSYLIPVSVIVIEYQVFIKLQLSAFAPSDDKNIYLIQRIYFNAIWLLGVTSFLVWVTIKLSGIRGKFLSAPWVIMMILLFCLFLLLIQWFNLG